MIMYLKTTTPPTPPLLPLLLPIQPLLFDPIVLGDDGDDVLCTNLAYPVPELSLNDAARFNIG
ncbi:hypothetical protein DERP_006110 [Dermatophagoides pteronyssinus]|uniref:Uncharacterized protein n=1 Tax=Dermatophagoides pteronyssinus TaxID=6956 RepID=A0ABQ8JT71_DERPT|nr:hypothetical protein DERP_006110 [Dermatophagoides pteronyssinus]